jgi:homoaconitase/3-isopropylmalate dehydratase large subunit
LVTNKGANYKVFEFHGETIRNMPTSGRLTVCNMSVEAGATAGIIPPDDETINYLRNTAGVTDEIDILLPDDDAEYDSVIDIDVTTLEPQIAKPHTVDNVSSIDDVKGVKIDQIVIGSCTNGRLDDIKTAADILRGKKIADDVRLLVFPASGRIYREAMEKGYFKDLIDAGAVIANPGCGPCLGVHQGALGTGERALSTTNRNFKGRMGNPESEVYLCSPAVAAASAITGVISEPKEEK